MESAGDWCLIESDPGVFTYLLKKFGAKGVQIDEVWSLEDGGFEILRPIHGLIFLFKYVPNEEPSGPIVTDNRLDKIYFAKQVINNACATQAVISLLLNCQHPDLELGPELTKLKEFSMSFDPRMRGLALSNSQTIRSVHNSAAQPTLFEYDSKTATKDDDAFHYVGFIPIDGRVYELDGLKEGPIDHGPYNPDKDWTEVVRPVIRRRVDLYCQGEIRMNLMALVTERKLMYQRHLHLLHTDPQALEPGMVNPVEITMEINKRNMLIEFEEKKAAEFEREMARRRHNYLPFIIMLLKILAEEKMLTPLLEKAKDRAVRKGPKKLKV